MAFMRLKACVVAAGLLLASASAGDKYEVAFRDFMQTYGRNYSPEEERSRFAIFKENVQLIESENAKGNPYTLGVNEFADQAPEEFRATRLGLSPSASKKLWVGLPHLGTHNYTGATLAGAIDWVAKGAVTPPKNQKSCGSCWSFSTTGALEGAWQIATGKLLSLSEQQLVDCSKENHGCGGGSMDLAFKFEEGVNVCTEDSYPYVAKNGQCKAGTCTVGIPKGGVTGFKDVTADDESALMEAVMQQPVSIAIEADQSAFQLYNGGILTKKCGDKLDHGVLLVGYGTDNGIDYWKVKNSWGPSWGESGYIRMVRGVKEAGECGINAGAVYPVVHGMPGPAPGPSPTPAPVPPAPAKGNHYGKPPCQSDEKQASIQGANGVVCAPSCDGSGSCPSDVPHGTLAKPSCSLRDPQQNSYCALACYLSMECPDGSSCAVAKGSWRGICVYPATSTDVSLLSIVEAETAVVV